MENKYYTPTLEEFHVGFNYEAESTQYPDKNNWHPETFYMNEGHFNLVNINTLHSKKVRVKHLDREDIESLGWVKHGNNFIIKRKNCYTLYPYRDKGYGIMKVTWSMFQGSLKNKSELKKLMDQLGI